jgi:hypothetical protein
MIVTIKKINISWQYRGVNKVRLHEMGITICGRGYEVEIGWNEIDRIGIEKEEGDAE